MSLFEQTFGFAPEAIARAPGRVNLLGEHTDYNDGYVLPTILPQQTEVSLGVSHSGAFQFQSVQLPEAITYGEGERPPSGYGRYIQGCIELFEERHHSVPPLAILVDSAVPIGAGLSSSAALEVATLRALRTRFGVELDDTALALLAHQAEVRFAGVRCGIMDQMVSSLGSPGHMLFLDTRSLERALLPLPPDSEMMVIDSGVPRSLAASGYNTRRAECEAAAQRLGVRALRDVQDVSVTKQLEPPLDRRARHVVTENARVLEARRGVDATAFGALMSESHASLRDDFEVSTAELDLLVGLLQSLPQVHGARLTGAGFGGACVALLRQGEREPVMRRVLSECARQGLNASILV
jgi:galactokinase